MNHPNAYIGAGAGVVGGELAVGVADQFGVHLNAAVGVLAAGVVTWVVLAIGRGGLRGLLRLLWRGRDV